MLELCILYSIEITGFLDGVLPAMSLPVVHLWADKKEELMYISVFASFSKTVGTV